MPPTQIPPTDPPPPTEIPPTEIPATEVPPTEIPATEVPTETPTQTPNPFPTTPSVRPTNPPSQPSLPQPSVPVDTGEVAITCVPVSSEATPIADAASWDLRRCTMSLSLGGIKSLDIRAFSSDPGWRVVLLDPDDARTPGLLNASNNRTVVDEFNDGRAEFLLGTQLTCSTLGATTLEFAIIGSAGGSSNPLAATGTLALERPTPPKPTVVLTAADIDSSGATPAGSFAFTWERDEPALCPWQISLTLTGAGDLEVMDLAGPVGIAAVTSSGAVIITIPPGSLSGDAGLDVAFLTGTPTAVGVEAQVRP